MKIIICGAGQVGWQIARHLAGERNDVTVIDVAAEKPLQSIQVGQMPWGVAVTPN